MSFTIITTLSPSYAAAMDLFIPSWFRNSGADEIVIHQIDEGSWAKNILKRNELWIEEVMARGGKLLFLDADCMVVSDLWEGFRGKTFSLARWPVPNMGAVFLDLQAAPGWLLEWMAGVCDEISDELAISDDPESGYGFDQTVWHRQLAGIAEHVHQLDETIWNYNRIGIDQWRKDLPAIKNEVKILHFKHHGAWPMDCVNYAKELFDNV